MNDDLISRQDAFDLLDEFEEGIEVGDRSAYTRTRKKMCELPSSAQPTPDWETVNDAHNEGYDVGYWAGRRDYAQQWIPCSERPPEDGEKVFITTSWDAIEIAWHDEDGWNADMYSLDDDEVKAWMPRPEPWKGEEQ